MRTLQIKLRNFNQVQELNSIALSMFNRCEFEDPVDYYNAKDLCKRLADAVFKYSNRRQKQFSVSIGLNQYRALSALVEANLDLLNDEAMIYHYALLQIVLEQGRICLETKYPIVLQPLQTNQKLIA